MILHGGRIRRGAFPEMAEVRVGAGMLRRAVVGINHVARRAAATAIITRLVICSRQRKKRIEKARLLQTEKHGIGAEQSAEAALAQLVVRTPRFFLRIGIPDLSFFRAAALEDAQDVARLRKLPALEGSEFGQNALRASFLWRGRWNCAH